MKYMVYMLIAYTLILVWIPRIQIMSLKAGSKYVIQHKGGYTNSDTLTVTSIEKVFPTKYINYKTPVNKTGRMTELHILAKKMGLYIFQRFTKSSEKSFI